jgi:hypothetical protein
MEESIYICGSHCCACVCLFHGARRETRWRTGAMKSGTHGRPPQCWAQLRQTNRTHTHRERERQSSYSLSILQPSIYIRERDRETCFIDIFVVVLDLFISKDPGSFFVCCLFLFLFPGSLLLYSIPPSCLFNAESDIVGKWEETEKKEKQSYKIKRRKKEVIIIIIRKQSACESRECETKRVSLFLSYLGQSNETTDAHTHTHTREGRITTTTSV